MLATNTSYVVPYFSIVIPETYITHVIYVSGYTYILLRNQ